jgi:hypothetical protein
MRTPTFEEDAYVLLKAALDLLKECERGPYVKNAMEVTVFYDDAECDGYCLMEDIENLLLSHDNAETDPS